MKYDEIINLMLNLSTVNYASFYQVNLEEDSNFSNKDSRLMQSIRDAKSKGAIIHQVDQNEDPSDFCHIAVNRGFSGDGIKSRLYMSPKRVNIHNIAIELVNKSLASGGDIYFKYARSSTRLDQMIIYLKDQKDINKKMELLKKIKLEHPELFEDMKKSVIWLNETELPNIFLEPEPVFHDRFGRQSSYGAMFKYALADTKTILEYGYGIKENESLKDKRFDPNFYSNFDQIFTEMLKRYGIYMQKDKQNGGYSIIARPLDPFEFEYDKKSQTITETRYGDYSKRVDYSYAQKSQKEFFSTILVDEQQVQGGQSAEAPSVR